MAACFGNPIIFSRVCDVPRYDFNAPRLFVESELAADLGAPLNPDQVNYLRAALRMREGDRVLAFNGRDGEWSCELEAASRKTWRLRARERTRAQEIGPDLHYLFAPLKLARQDYIAQKAVEMGASRLRPTLTRRTQARQINLARLRANAIEGAEQCGVLWIPDIDPPTPLEAIVRDWPGDRLLAFCDEEEPCGDPVAALREAPSFASFAILIGPEGGFDPQEREMLRRLPQAVALSLGPRILRADTAAVAALAVLQTALGDWR
jgi:16S rRNA (uracil1498-N3)-methyltransferase